MKVFSRRGSQHPQTLRRVSGQAVDLVTEQAWQPGAANKARIRKRPVTSIGNNDVAVDWVHQIVDPNQPVLRPRHGWQPPLGCRQIVVETVVVEKDWV